MDWPLGFISEEDFVKHVGATIERYGEKLESYDVERFNKNMIDPIKLIFDKTVYQASWEKMVGNEIFSQRDKSNNNDIGYFHQRIFQYIDKCRVPENGREGGWDVIYQNENGISLPDGDIVHTVYVEMKNKHNTMNSASAGKTYIKMQNQLLSDDDCACFLVEAIAQKSQNIKWETTVDGRRVSHKRIRRVSLDQFYAITTGEKDAFYHMCMVLPCIIEKVVKQDGTVRVPRDTVLQELENIAVKTGKKDEDMAMAIAIYLLGFHSYLGFSDLIGDKNGSKVNENYLKEIYAYAKEAKKARTFQYLLFDLDGTLTDPKVGITTCVQYALRKFGIEEPDLDKLEGFIGPPLADSFQEFYGFDEEQIECAIRTFRERFSTIGLFENEIYPGMKEMLAHLKAEGKRLAVASSKATVFVNKILQHFEIAQYFDVVMGSELDGTRTKKEEVMEEAIRELCDGNKLDNDTAVMIGDRKFDIEGAKAFGLASIGVSYGYACPGELEEAGADYIVDTVSELEALLLGGDVTIAK